MQFKTRLMVSCVPLVPEPTTPTGAGLAARFRVSTVVWTLLTVLDAVDILECNDLAEMCGYAISVVQCIRENPSGILVSIDIQADEELREH